MSDRKSFFAHFVPRFEAVYPIPAGIEWVDALHPKEGAYFFSETGEINTEMTAAFYGFWHGYYAGQQESSERAIDIARYEFHNALAADQHIVDNRSSMHGGIDASQIIHVG